MREILKPLLVLVFLSASLASEAAPCPDAAKGTIVFSRANDRLTWVDCAEKSDPAPRFDVPLGARPFPFKRQILKDKYKGHYQKTVTKLDVFWFDDIITINTPLRSFGGDIILVADTININAAIDSRLYIEHNVDHFADADPNWRTSDGTFKPTVKTSDHIFGHDTYRAAFSDYYLKCFDCISGETRFPELPAGLAADTPALAGQARPYQKDGFAPEDDALDLQEIKSGRIWLFASKINIKGDSPSYPGERAECRTRELPKVVSFLLNAGGLTGGRGGAGSASPCVVRRDLVMNCRDDFFTSPGGLSGIGGRGGDAGDVRLFVRGMNKEQATRLKEALKGVVNVSGGTAGLSKRYRTPPGQGNGAVQPNRCSFNDGPDGPPGQEGAPGEFQVQGVSSDESFSTIARLISAKSSRPDFDIFTLLNMGKVDSRVRSLDPSSVLTDFLVEQLVNAQIDYLQSLEQLFAAKINDGKKSFLPLMLDGLTKNALRTAPITDEQASLVRELLVLQGPEGASSVLRNTGGLFNVGAKDVATSRMAVGRLRADVSVTNLGIAEIRQELRDVNVHDFTEMAADASKELQRRVDSVHASIAGAQAAFKAVLEQHSMDALIGHFKEISDGIDQAFKSYASSDYFGATQGVVHVGHGLQGIADWDGIFLPPDLTREKKALEALMGELDGFLSYLADAKQEWAARRLGDAADVMKARSAIRSKLASESFLVDDLAKVAVVGFLDDPSRDSETLRTNLSAIQTFLKGFPAQEPFIKLRQIDWSCASAPLRCNTFEASQRPRDVMLKWTTGNTTVRVPLYIMAPQGRQLQLPMFGVANEDVTVTTR